MLESSPPDVDSGEPLLFIYDCETTRGSHMMDHIIEIAAMVLAPEGVHITNTGVLHSCHTSICAQGVFVVL